MGGRLGLVGALIFVAIQLIGGGSVPFDVERGFGGGVQAPGQPAGIPPSEDPERDLKDFSGYVFTDARHVREHRSAAAVVAVAARRSGERASRQRGCSSGSSGAEQGRAGTKKARPDSASR